MATISTMSSASGERASMPSICDQDQEGDQRDEGADHEDVAMGEIDHADDAVDHRVADGDQPVDRAERQPVDELLDEIFHSPATIPWSALSGHGSSVRRLLLLTWLPSPARQHNGAIGKERAATLTEFIATCALLFGLAGPGSVLDHPVLPGGGRLAEHGRIAAIGGLRRNRCRKTRRSGTGRATSSRRR